MASDVVRPVLVLARRAATTALVLAWSLCATLAAAQSAPWREAPIIEPWTPVEPARASSSPQSVVQVFLNACVQNDGQPAAVVDWALANGFEPLDGTRTGADDLLGGEPGSVLVVPGSAGQVLLAVSQGQRCVVWAEQMSGPALRNAFQKMTSSLGFKGAKLQTVVDRNLATAGVWRNQSQWRYRRAGGEQDFGLGSATTLVDAPHAQLLHFAPLPPAAPPAPDGLPAR